MPDATSPTATNDVAGQSGFLRFVETVTFQVALIAAVSAFTAALVTLLFASRQVDQTAASLLLQPLTWVVVAAAVVVCTAIAARLASRMVRPLDLLAERASLLFQGASPTADGWPQATGEVGKLIATLRQVALARETAQQAQHVMVNQLKAILDNASVGILFTRDGRFELTGRQMCLMVGWSESEMRGQLTRMIYPSEEAFTELGGRVREQFKAQGYFDGELQFKRKDGGIFWVHMLGRGVVANDPSGGTIWIVEDITESRATREQLSWTATHDALTKLVNRREFEARLAQAMQQFQGRQTCVIFIDLDRFKAVNDTAGHAAGDEVLRQLAAVFESRVRQSDTVARMGGDEFAVLLPGCSLGRALEIAEQIRTGVEGWRLLYQGQEFTVGASLGVVQVASDLPTVAAVLNAADSACYEAKRGGKNRVETFRAK